MHDPKNEQAIEPGTFSIHSLSLEHVEQEWPLNKPGSQIGVEPEQGLGLQPVDCESLPGKVKLIDEHTPQLSSLDEISVPEASTSLRYVSPVQPQAEAVIS